MIQPSLLTMEGVIKEFSGIRALNGVTLQVNQGEIHAICGENGAGKSTLMKILSGIYPYGTYSGSIKIASKQAKFLNIKSSEKAGIVIIHQELSLVKEMTITENIFLGAEMTKGGLIHWDKSDGAAHKLLLRVGLKISPRTRIKQLGVGQQQLVEIAKALSKNPKILVLDEPTSALAEREIKGLLDLLRDLKKQHVTSIMISHKLDEVFEVADRITILRDGCTISTLETSQTSPEQVIALMVGRELKALYPPKKEHSQSPRTPEPLLELKNYEVRHPHQRNQKILANIHFNLYPGKILGIAGLMGSGRSELLMSLFGDPELRPSGEILMDGKKILIRSPHHAIRLGLSLVSEDRKRFGLILNEPITRNMTLSSLNILFKKGWTDSDKEAQLAEKYRNELKLKTSSLQTWVKKLSGGNQQKVVLAKCLMTQPKVLLLDEPTRGIDVGARAEIYQLIRDLAQKGLAIIMVSSELPEILGMSDHVLVLNQGKQTGYFETHQTTSEEIMTAATLGLSKAGARQ